MNDTAVKAVAAMSVFYRNSLSKGRFIIPLKQELELTEQYLYIQSLRYMELPKGGVKNENLDNH
ncbi:histidine kinase [Blautia pseudococcoides]|uniref:Signal transduction histidine kinase internal region domain-containing protein n=1 Tax=Blautia pseudococcoides TaxID=1796616 RepID=A0A1V0QEQ3_9FIRM|nr:histidine kinase [Blautia pseudococcoides]ARE64928.1 hypothetical protein A4V09_24290 [Blautia pseudococcoides]ASU30165.1 hypothetical protein ADH70_015975 [Blautia pseudococcoides]QQQ94949.1 histidine kinase [Blautia pseudococcoides]